MSKLHVTQIAGYLKSKLQTAIDMSDCENHEQSQRLKIFLSRGLSVLAASHLTELPIDELAKSVVDGGDDGGIDLIYFHPGERTLYLVQSKWHEDGHGSIELGDALKFISGVKRVLDNDIDGLNEKIRNKRQEIESALHDANAKFALIVAHTGQEKLSDAVQEEFDKYVNAQNDTSDLMQCTVLNQSHLHKAVATDLGGSPVSAEVQLSGWGQIREPHFAIYGQVCAADVAGWMQEHGVRLFERNLRQFLAGSPVNQEIVNTLIQRPKDFWYFNNGITAVAARVAKKPIGGNSTASGVFECSGFSVVNGAQTVGSILAAAEQDALAVSEAMVPVRIISSEASPEAFASEVTRFTNTQNAIQNRDFVALDPEQERIRKELSIEGIEYAYKSGSAGGSVQNRFDLTDATVALACSNPDVSLAVHAKTGLGRLWEDIAKAPYKQIFNPSVSGPAVWEAVQVLRIVDEELAKATKKRSGRENLICVHGNRFIEWAVLNALASKTGHSVATASQKASALVHGIVEQLIQAVKLKYPDAYPASLFKNMSKCKVLAGMVSV
ncbi:AIPR family protein [Burkholderia ubonensis]|uniref:AIPR family protein n=1 Tax=Burkholderia ubonensis TaxID=101571 RepID=UPI0007C63F53|nr:AIPR family protein [Burkholderia ubonensis]